MFGRVYLSAGVKGSSVRMDGWVFVWVLSIWRQYYIPRNEIGNFVGIAIIVCIKVLVYISSSKLCSFLFFIVTFHKQGMWYIVILICIFLVTNVVKHLLVIGVSRLEKYLLKLSAFHILTGLSFCWGLRHLCVFWILNPYQIKDFQLFSPVRFLHFLHNVLCLKVVLYFILRYIHLF